MRSWLIRILVGSSTLFFGLMTVPLVAYVLVDRQPPIAVRPVELVKTSDNEGSRCPDRHWDSLSEHPVCYRLQEKLGTAASDGDEVGLVESLRTGANTEGSYYQADESLGTAAMKGHLKIVKALIENGADTNSVGKWNMSPLQKAVQYEHYPIAKVLLENGADVCHSAYWDDLSTPTALDIAVGKRNIEMIKLLTAFGAPFCMTH